MVAEHLGDIKRLEVIPGELPESYYDFGTYVSRERMLTFWHQLNAVLACRPTKVLEVGVGSRVVAGTLRERGIDVTTLDLNSALKPTVVGRVQDLDQHFEPNSFDVVLCARVLHHVPFEEFGECVKQLGRASRRHVVLTLPVDDLRVYLSGRLTSKPSRVASIKLPNALKKAVMRQRQLADTYYARLWKIGSSRETSLREVQAVLEPEFTIDQSYAMPEDRSHRAFVLTKRNNAGGKRDAQ